jgi:hypothetical protein
MLMQLSALQHWRDTDKKKPIIKNRVVDPD